MRRLFIGLKHTQKESYMSSMTFEGNHDDDSNNVVDQDPFKLQVVNEGGLNRNFGPNMWLRGRIFIVENSHQEG